jgi:hypothetical protein
MSRSRLSLLLFASAFMLGALYTGASAQGAAVEPSSGGSSLRIADFSAGLGPGGVPAGWRLVRHAGLPGLSIGSGPASASLELRSSKSSFGLQRDLSVDLRAFPRLSWIWRADTLPAGGDFRSASKDDQAAQLYVAFSRTRVIGYVWDSTAPAQTQGDAQGIPPFARVRILVLRSGAAEAGKWLTEERDVVADYRRLFGEDPPSFQAIGIRLYINSQHTSSEAACAFADIAFRGAGR